MDDSLYDWDAIPIDGSQIEIGNSSTYNNENDLSASNWQQAQNNQMLRQFVVNLLKGIMVQGKNRAVGYNETAIRMNVNQITFAVLISVLLVANVFLVWSFGYIVIYYEKQGKHVLRHYRAVKRNISE